MNQAKKEKFVFHKGSYKSQCSYMLMLIRNKDKKAWLKFKQRFSEISDEGSYEFFNELVAFYKDEPYEHEVVELKPTAPIVKEEEKEEPKAAVKKKPAIKEPGKKPPAKKAPPKKKAPAKKKVTKKKVTKKKTAKKAAKKTAKKVTKKTAKKVTKKVAKKTAKKKVAKKSAKK